MEKEIQVKIKRFVELSKLFSKSENELFKKEQSLNQVLDMGSKNLTISSGTSYLLHNIDKIDGREVTIDKNGHVVAKDDKPLSRSQKMLAKANQQAKLSDDFDEYLKLQGDLTEYFKSVDKLINR